MIAQLRRLPRGGRVDRSRPLRFRFDGREYEGLAGDTLASALLANGVAVVGRGIQTGRPRGIFSAGPEEPNALVQVGNEPMLRATQVELAEGLVAESLAGKGRLIDAPDTGRFDKRYIHCEVLVVGGGRSGRAAVVKAARTGGRVILVSDDPDITELAGVRTLARATAIGYFDHGYVLVAEHRPGEGTEGRLWHIRAGRVVLAPGAIERPIAFPDNDRPGVMLAGAARKYVDRFAVKPGERAVAFTTNDGGLAAAQALPKVGVEIAAIVDARDGGRVIGTEADADGRLSGVRLDDGSAIEADLLLVSGGWNPNVALFSQSRGTLRFDDRIAAYVPDRPFQATEVVGSATGEDLPTTLPLWIVDGDPETSFVDLERDATVADVQRAVDAGLRSIEHIKRYTTIGTASDQGKTSGTLTSAIAAALLGQDPGALGVPTFRPPYTPVSFGSLAGRDRGDLHDPIRVTPMHEWHATHGAVFEDVGQWKRARYYPRKGESMEDAVLRECAAAREGVAVMDATTLGKIDLQGPDAGLFLDRVYTNAFAKLKVGSCRYGVMCKLDGMVFDDGVTSRLADDRFHMTTTTGNAGPVLDHLEEWLQTEWPELRVRCTSVTEQWAVAAVVGPRSRAVVAALAPELDVSAEAFPFMTLRYATVAGLEARVFRISFSGELAYEINVRTWDGPAMWQAVIDAGKRHRITPYGTEAMHVLRAEKGYPIIGQETDGSMTPIDLGMDWIVSKTKHFIGRRSLRRPDTVRPDRKQLVGLLPIDPEALLPEGAQLVIESSGRGHAGAHLGPRRVPMIGHVTSSYRSAALGRTFALAMVMRGRDRIGERVFAPLPEGVIEAEIASSVLFDPENARRDG